MRSILKVVTLWVLLPQVVWAAPPVAKLTGPTAGQPGDILVIDATASTDAEFFAWSVTPQLPDKVTILPLEGGRRCLVVSVPGTWHVFFAAGNAEGIDLVKWTVTVEGSTPDPGPKPQPLPDGRYQLARWAVNAAQSISDRSKADALAETFAAIAEQVERGEITSIDELQTKSTNANRAAVGTDRDLWLPWFTRLQAELKRLNGAGQMTTLADHVVAWREIATGLRTVK